MVYLFQIILYKKQIISILKYRIFPSFQNNKNREIQIKMLNTQTQPIADFKFLEVTINSKKLTELLENIYRQINKHELQIRTIRDVVPTLKKSVKNTLQQTQNRVQHQLQGLKNKLKENLDRIEYRTSKLQQQTVNNYIESQKKIKATNTQLDTLFEKQKQIQNTIKYYQQNQISKQNTIISDITYVKNNLINLEQNMQQVDERFNDQFQALFVKFQSMLNQNNVGKKVKKVEIFNPKIQTKRQKQIKPKKQNGKNGTNGISRRLTPYTATNWANFSAKISELEKSLQDQSLLSKSVIIQERFPTNRNFYEKQQIKNTDRTQIQQQNQRMIEQVKSIVCLYHQSGNKQLSQIKNKIVILQQKTIIQSRKMQKQQFQIMQINKAVKKVLQRKSDEQLVDILSNQMKKNFEEVAEDIQKKLYKDVYEREKIKILEKINVLQENLTQKVDKGEIKKALLFLEDKIKQLILIVANEQNDEKDGALRKIPPKCLSCDKQFELDRTPQTSRPVSPFKQNRTVTRKIRKRIQMMSSRQNSSVNL